MEITGIFPASYVFLFEHQNALFQFIHWVTTETVFQIKLNVGN